LRPGTDPNSRDRHYNRHLSGAGNYGRGVYGDDEVWANAWARDGKMEKSFVNFKENHPDWGGGGAEGAWLLASIRDFSRHTSLARHQQSVEALQHGSAGLEDSMVGVDAGAGADASAGGTRTSSSSTSLQGAGSQMLGDSRANQSLMLGSSIGTSMFRMPGSLSGAQPLASPSLALLETLTATAHENNFFWLQEYYANQVTQQPVQQDDLRTPDSSASSFAHAQELRTGIEAHDAL
jgi:hypothetical protein